MKRKVMIIDNDALFLEKMKGMLDLTGYSVKTVKDTERIPETIYESKPNIILLGLNMPENSGLKIAHKLKNDSMAQNIPVLGLDNDVIPEKKSVYKDVYGINDCIKKEIKPVNVISKIEMLS